MAYNNYYPVSYGNPYYYPTAPQPVMPQPQPQPQPQQQSGIIWVNSGIEAQAYPVAPNNAVTLWSTAEPVVYLKKTDASGKPTLITYDLVERKDTPNNKEEMSYATKDDLSIVASAVKGFDEAISGIKADIETMKGDVYGLAGKKRKVNADE